MGVKLVYDLYFTKRSVQDSWRRLDQLHMGHRRRVINRRNGRDWLGKLHTGRGI